MRNDSLVQALSPVERGVCHAPVSKGTDNLSCGALETADDIILPSGSDNDPFVVFLSLRAAFVPRQSFFAPSDPLLSMRSVSLVWVSPPDARSPHLYLLAKSVQLLC